MHQHSTVENTGNVLPAAIQAKLTIGEVNDPLEYEADAMADKVMRMPDPAFPPSSQQPPSIQRTCSECEEEERLQRKPLVSFIQKRENTQSSATPGEAVSTQIQATRGSGSGMDRQTRSFMESRFGTGFQDVRIHTGDYAVQLSRELNAHAFTVGNDVYFNEGKYQPTSGEGKHLLAHELTHTVQQSTGQSIQRDVIDMPATTISVGMPSDVSPLSTPVPAGQMTAAFDPAHIALNSQLPGTVLPFTASGWNGNEIAGKLGQYDQIPGTDSDAVRCVQAVALMSHILMGPAAAIDYLSSITLQGMLSAGRIETRQRTALNVIRFVRGQIENRTATYGNMYWAMEAVHDLFYGDSSGTPAGTAGTVREQITPWMDMSQTMTNVDVWCNNATELMAQAATLNAGEQFMLNTWTVNFNFYFDEIGAAPTARTARYERQDENGEHGRMVNIRRIDARTKPRGSQIDTNRDTKSGHQMLIYKDATDSHIKMYEPELTPTGNHLFDLTADSSVIDTMLFNDQPAFELYKYIQLWGKMTPSTFSTLGH